MDKKKNVPEIRFDGFEGEWEEVTLAEIGDIKTGKTPPTNEKLNYNAKGTMFITPTDITKGVTTVTKRYLSNEGVVKSVVADQNSTLVTCIASIGKNTYIKERAAFNQQINSITPKFGHNPYFIFVISHFWSKHMMLMAASGMMQIVNKSLFSKIKTMKPTEEEQTKIADLFKNLDEKLEIEKAKHQKLVNFKKAMLEDMFPREGDTVPKIRFDGFDGEWNMKKVEDLFYVTRGYVLATDKISKSKNSKDFYPVYSSQTLNDGLLGFYNDYLYEDSITWTTDGANAGTVNFRKGKFYSTNVNGVLLPKTIEPNLAIAEILNRKTPAHVTRVGNPKLMNNIMAKIEVPIPSDVNELLYISGFLNTINEKIKISSNRIEKIENFKKSMMDKMFV